MEKIYQWTEDQILNEAEQKAYHSYRVERQMYEKYHGKGSIPEGYDIHHIDGNPDNNSIENLIAIPHVVHVFITAMGIFPTWEELEKMKPPFENYGYDLVYEGINKNGKKYYWTYTNKGQNCYPIDGRKLLINCVGVPDFGEDYKVDKQGRRYRRCGFTLQKDNAGRYYAEWITFLKMGKD